jgi:peptidoglycan/xylan/chitin deacetylase (PgdA/CDA1 family)
MSEYARALPILMYHHVSPKPGLVTVSPATFRAQLEWLKTHGWRTVGCDELCRFLDGESLPARSVLLTFDDGYLDNWVHAHPALVAFGLKAIVFLITGWIGDGSLRGADADCPDHKTCMAAVRAGEQQRVMMNWPEVQAMRAAGTGEFHSHTHSHTRWDKQLPAGSERLAALANDLAQSQRTLTERLGAPSRHLCWPQGYHEPDYFDVAKAAGFDTLYTTEKRVVTPRSDRRRLGRIVVKDRADAWFGRRLKLFASPLLGRAYSALRGR